MRWVLGWTPDVVHAHDWQTGLVPAFLDALPQRPQRIFTIHNMAYGGHFPQTDFVSLHLPSYWWSAEGAEFYGGFSMLKAGIVYSDAVTTVSPTYAREICTPAFGYGMDGLLQSRSYKLHGILNGIDMEVWNPATDPNLPAHYSAEQIQPGKSRNKAALLQRFGAKDPDAHLPFPLLGMVSRLVEQKGVDLIINAIPDLLATTDARFVLIGAGHSYFEQRLLELAAKHPERVFVYIGYDEQLAHLLEAGADMFMMPSRFEPCGLNQMYSLRYGTPPIVLHTGGLADTVVDASHANLETGDSRWLRLPRTDYQRLERHNPAGNRLLQPAKALAAVTDNRHETCIRMGQQCGRLSGAIQQRSNTMTEHFSHHIPYVPVPLDPLLNDAESLGDDFQRYLSYHLGRFQGCPPVYLYQALAYTLRDRLMVDWRSTWGDYMQPGKRRAYYMSLEFLIGRSLSNNLLNLDICEPTRSALLNYCTNMEEVSSQEPDAGLGNGGLGRLAACFMDSCATLKLPVIGYGIRYEYGMFRQHIENGYQIEDPDHWLRDHNPWELERAEYSQRVQFGGYTEHFVDHSGQQRVRWVGTNDVLAVPFDMPISGYKNNTVNTLRLWKATATDEFNLDEFNAGSYTEAVEAKNHAEHISMVLYPNDSSENGKELRLRQQYFLASASLQDAIRLWERQGNHDYSKFAAEHVFQMNDTHPTIAVAELMRILMDDKGLGWEAGVGNHLQLHGVHQPHLATGSTGTLGSSPVRQTVAAFAGNYLRNQRPFLARSVNEMAG